MGSQSGSCIGTQTRLATVLLLSGNLDERAPRTWTLEEARRLFERHEALFIDAADGEVRPRLPAGCGEAVVAKTFNEFYGSMVSYELTLQWIAEDGPLPQAPTRCDSLNLPRGVASVAPRADQHGIRPALQLLES